MARVLISLPAALLSICAWADTEQLPMCGKEVSPGGGWGITEDTDSCDANLINANAVVDVTVGINGRAKTSRIVEIVVTPVDLESCARKKVLVQVGDLHWHKPSAPCRMTIKINLKGKHAA